MGVLAGRFYTRNVEGFRRVMGSISPDSLSDSELGRAIEMMERAVKGMRQDYKRVEMPSDVASSMQAHIEILARYYCEEASRITTLSLQRTGLNIDYFLT